jgi:hypothetical protein
MNVKSIFLLCAVVVLGVIGFMVYKSDKPNNDNPVPSREFDEWRKRWEKQR